jgi:hypothetical protein
MGGEMEAPKQLQGTRAITVQDGIRVEHVANLGVRLASAGEDGESLRRELEELGYDQTLVRESNEDVSHYVLREKLRAGPVRLHSSKIEISQVTHASTPVLDVAPAVVSKGFLFVSAHRGVWGVITRADLQKVPVRVAIFGLLTSLELGMRDTVVRHAKNSDPLHLISAPRRAAAMALHAERVKRRQELRKIDCCQLADLGTMASRLELHESVFHSTSKGRFAKDFKRVSDLRNSIAHGNNLDLDDLPSALTTLHELLAPLSDLAA